MNVEKINNLDGPEQTTERLKNQVLDKIKNLENANKISEAIELSLNLHFDERPRPDGPYLDHILRGLNRLLDLGIDDSDILIASAFHDSVEDQSQRLADKNSNSKELKTRERALDFLRKKYGEKVASIVNSVSNPEDLGDFEREEANRRYVSHIKQEIEDPNVFYVKLSDFIDNGLKLMDISDIQRRVKLAKKYLPLFQIFMDRIKRDDIAISQERKNKIIDELSKEEPLVIEIINQS